MSRGTLCLMTPREHLRTRVCQSGMWDAGPEQMGGGLDLTGSVQNHNTLHEPPGLCSGVLSAPEHRLSIAFLA